MTKCIFYPFVLHLFHRAKIDVLPIAATIKYTVSNGFEKYLTYKESKMTKLGLRVSKFQNKCWGTFRTPLLAITLVINTTKHRRLTFIVTVINKDNLDLMHIRIFYNTAYQNHKWVLIFFENRYSVTWLFPWSRRKLMLDLWTKHKVKSKAAYPRHLNISHWHF